MDETLTGAQTERHIRESWGDRLVDVADGKVEINPMKEGLTIFVPAGGSLHTLVLPWTKPRTFESVDALLQEFVEELEDGAKS